MTKVIDITARIAARRDEPSDLDVGLDTETVALVDQMEQIVHAYAREIAIEIVRRGGAVVTTVPLEGGDDGEIACLHVGEV